MTSLPRSNVRSFVAGFIAATALSGIAMALPGTPASLSESPTRTFNADQMMYFFPEWMDMYDLDHNGVPDPFGRGIRADNNTSVALMFVSLDGDNVPDFCQLSAENAALCGVPFVGGTLEGLYSMVPEICDNGIDDEQDGMIDCADSQCDEHPACVAAAAAAPEVSVEICDNYIDDDADTIYDCWDSDCMGDPACESIAAPVVEPVRNEADTAAPVSNTVTVPTAGSASTPPSRTVPVVPLVMPVTPVPVIVPIVTPSSVAPVVPAPQTNPASAPSAIFPYDQYIDPRPSAPIDEFNVIPMVPTVGQYSFDLCPNTRGDNDNDGIQNALDPACRTGISGSNSSPMHGSASEICANRMDDNNNGLVDCGDPLCTGNPVCTVAPGQCTDGMDNNEDGYIDAADMGCRSQLGHEGM